jgi:hypothetical protein
MAGIMKLQSNRNKASGVSRAMLRSDLSECETDGFDVNGYSETADTSLLPSAFTTPLSASPLLSSIATTKALPPSKLPAVLTDRTNIFGTPMISSKGGAEEGPSAIPLFPGTQYEQMFGKLPDPIRLHEQTGAFDGQVVFVGHPNRDISAHQWSSVSFQWINIGRYAYARDKIEGSLASDRRKGYSDSHTPLQFFMLAANNREKFIMENGRLKEENIGTHQPTATETARITLSSEASSLTNHAMPCCTRKGSPPGSLFEPTTTTSSRQTTVRRDYLEDPFIAPTKHVSPGIAPCLQLRKEDKRLRGSLNSAYEFPFEPVLSRGPVAYRPDGAAFLDIFQGQPNNHGETFYGDTNRYWDHLSRPALREVSFGEEAASSLAASSRFDLLPSKFSHASSPENTGQQCRNESPVLGSQTTHSGISPADHVVIPSFAHLQPTARSLLPPPGLTVANPHRRISGRHTPASPYTKTLEVTEISEPSGSEATIVDAAAVMLRFSDPDGMKFTQEYEIANGLSQQTPTMQNFKGPFFTDTKPTTSDPTALLSVHTSEDEKLVNWFRDGHRPARQQEYARSLISATTSSSRYRTIGVIGQGFDAHRRRHYENTPSFVRLYEGLSEYAEEYRNGSERSYFTRAWKVALPRFRDLGPDGNNSYYSRCFTTPAKDAINI